MLIFYVMIAMNVVGSNFLIKYLLSFPELFNTSVVITMSSIIPYVVSIMFVISTIIMMFYIYVKSKSPIGINCLLAAYISQFVMVMAHDTAYRTTFLIIIFIIIALADIIKLCYKEKIHYYYICCMPFIIYQWQFGLIMLLIMLFLESIFVSKKNNNIQLIVFLVMLFVGAMLNYCDIYIKYKENKIVYIENVNILKNYDGEKEVYLRKYLNKEGCFGDMVGEKWIENDIKKLYRIDESVKFLELE